MSFITDQIDRIKSNVLNQFSDIMSSKLSGEPFGCPTSDQEEIIKLLTENSAFQNSMDAVVTTIKNAITPVNEYLEQLKDNLPLDWSEEDVDNLINQLNIFSGTMDTFKNWTDRLSGVIKVDGLPDADTIFSVMNSYQHIFSCIGLDVPSSQDEAKQMMSSLLIDKIETDYSSSYISSIPSLIQNGATPSEIVQALSDNQAIYTDAMITDENAFTQAMTSITNQATGLNLSTMDPFNSGYQMIIDKCGSDKLKELLS